MGPLSEPAGRNQQAALVRRAANDSAAFWSLVEPYDRGLRALAFRLLGDADLMDDALQEAYLKAFRSLPAFYGGSDIGTWLYRIVYNACIDELRRTARRRHVGLDHAAEATDRRPDPADTAALRGDLASALATLPADMRAAVLLVDAEGMDYRQAAGVLGIAPGTVASRVNRARGRLRVALRAEGGER